MLPVGIFSHGGRNRSISPETRSTSPGRDAASVSGWWPPSTAPYGPGDDTTTRRITRRLDNTLFRRINGWNPDGATVTATVLRSASPGARLARQYRTPRRCNHTV